MISCNDSTELTGLTARQLAQGVRNKQFTATTVARHFLDHIARQNPGTNAFTLVTAERALREASDVDACISRGTDPGPLAGVPYSVKNLFDLEGVVTLAGSAINADHPPAQQDATCVQRLREAGALCLGATNMGEYAYDFTTTNAHYGATRNPLDSRRSAGGSSGGSAASVLADMCPLSMGTDTNGSMRVPASFCGIWSLKPGYGRLSRAGSFPFVTSLDTIGVFAKSVRDLALSFDAISGPDTRDRVCIATECSSTAARLDAMSALPRLARLSGYFADKGDPEIHAAVDEVCRRLDTNRKLELDEPGLARAAAYTITASEGGSLHRHRLATRAADFDPATRSRFIAGLMTPTAWYLQAQRFRSLWETRMAKVFAEVDVLLAPATPLRAPLLTDRSFRFGDQELPLGPNIGLFTQPLTLIGLPVLTVPVQIPGGLPTGIQLVARHGNEELLLQLALHLEQSGICTPSDAAYGT